jgi:hypothetical protein
MARWGITGKFGPVSLVDCTRPSNNHVYKLKRAAVFIDPRSQWQRRLAVITCLVIAITGCATSGPTVISFNQQQTALTLIKKSEGTSAIERVLSKGQPAVLRNQTNAPKEAKVLAACGAQPFITEGGVGPILGLLLGSTINVLLDRADAALQKRIERYTLAYSAEDSVSFYAPFKNSAPNDITTDYSCLRFVRGDKDGGTSHVDFVASIRIVDSSWIEVLPERMYFSVPTVPSSNSRYGVAFKLKATTIHREEATGVRATAFDDVILKEKVDLKSQPYFLKYYEGADRPVIRLPLLPHNVPHLEKTAREFTTFELSVAEAGNPSEGLKLVAQAFSGAREDIAKVLAAAANEHLGWEEDK